VATDDQRIASAVEGFGGIARMTGAHHRTGMDRIAEVARDLTCAIIVNVQGDEPGVEPSAIALMIEALINDPALQMATLRTPIRHEEDYESPHVVKVVVDASDNALYFSRAPIPYHREGPPGGPRDPEVGSGVSRTTFKHLGLYAYRRDFSPPPRPRSHKRRSNRRKRSSSCARSNTATVFVRWRPTRLNRRRYAGRPGTRASNPGPD
jgi:3-deoxy-manno-octulosonate cytidylyltransferase (CMP-KDO synthetase)